MIIEVPKLVKLCRFKQRFTSLDTRLYYRCIFCIFCKASNEHPNDLSLNFNNVRTTLANSNKLNEVIKICNARLQAIPFFLYACDASQEQEPTAHILMSNRKITFLIRIVF